MYRISAPDADTLTVNLPSSKSVTHRALILGALNDGKTYITDPLLAEDTQITMQALTNMGAVLQQEDDIIAISKPIGTTTKPEIYLGNSGSSARFLLPLGAYLDQPFHFYGSDRLHQRPFGQLFSALKHFGITVDSHADTLPAKVHPNTVKGGSIRLQDLPSSQIITALMLAGLWMEKDLEIILPQATPSLPYIMMTFKLMKRLGLSTEYAGNRIYVNTMRPNLDWNLRVEKDFSAASYWVVFALLHGIKMVLPHVTLPSLQGDERIFQLADLAGAEVMLYPDRLELHGTITTGIEIDGNDIPDLVPALSVLAMFAPDKSRITNIKHLEYKESNRITAIRTNIELLGGKTSYHDGNLEIFPQSQYTSADLKSFNDHRIAMSFAVAGTRIPGTCITDPECVRKSYPDFWQDFKYWQEVEDA